MNNFDLKIDDQFLNICKKIISENKTVNEWSEIESDDYFSEKNYVGGFDATEQAFCFSYYNPLQKEFWFQITLDEIKEIMSGKKTRVSMRLAEC